MRRQFLSTLALAASGLWLASCDSQKVTGTVDETNASVARLLDTTGTPVAGANLLVYLPDSTGNPTASGVTLADGTYSLPTVRDGLYRVVARVQSTGKVAVQDSVYTSQGKLLVRNDTVRSPGSLYGTVKLVGDDNPASVSVSVLGSDVSVVNANSDGTYQLDGLGAGTWKLKFSTVLSGYTSTYLTVQSKAAVAVKVDTVALNYVDIPPVADLKAVYDTVTGVVHLSWSVPATTKGIRDIQVLRVDRASTADPAPVGTSDSSSYADLVYPDFNPNKLDFHTSVGSYPSTTWLYNVRIRTNSGSVGRVAYVNVTTVDPATVTPVPQFSQIRPTGNISSLEDTVGIVLAVRSPKYALETVTWRIPGLTKGSRVLHVTRTSPTDTARLAFDTVYIRASDIDTDFYSQALDSTSNRYLQVEIVDSSGHRFEYPKLRSTTISNLRDAIRELHQPKTTTDTSHKDSTVVVDTSHHDTTVSTDTTHHDTTTIPSQHVRDSLQRQNTLDSLSTLKFYYTELLDSARVSRDSTTSADTAALKVQIQQIQHLYDSLLAAPLAGVVGTVDPSRFALRDPRSWSGREVLGMRPEDLWLRDEERSIS